jgi:tRNA wybutosine-synthesizing protein 1
MTLTMANVPWHEEVLHFVNELASRLPDYEISSEHEHSNCVLISHKKFRIDGHWHTWIDYEEFHRLHKLHEEDNER